MSFLAPALRNGHGQGLHVWGDGKLLASSDDPKGAELAFALPPSSESLRPHGRGGSRGEKQEADAVAEAAEAWTSFTSNGGLYCAEGPPRVAQAALAVKKASVVV